MSQELLSAQVVLQAAPAAEQEEVRREFARAGFQIGVLFANSFSITAPAEKFADYFRTGPLTPAAGIPELPRQTLPHSVRDRVQAILFTRPPDFGPGGDF